MPKNPFTVSFSRKPLEYIERMLQTDQVIETFTEDPVTDQIFVITGLRGSGKTVLMSSIASDLEADKDWVVERAISTRDMVQELAVDLEDKKISSKAALISTSCRSVFFEPSKRFSNTTSLNLLLVSSPSSKLISYSCS